MRSGEHTFVPSERRAGILRRWRGPLVAILPFGVWCGGIAGVLYLAQLQPPPYAYRGLALPQEYVVSAPVRAQVQRLLVTEQSEVEPGQLVARLDEGDVELRIGQVRRSIHTLQAECESEHLLREESAAREQFDRLTGLRRRKRDVESVEIDILRVSVDIEEQRMRLASMEIERDVQARLQSQEFYSAARATQTGYDAKAIEKRIDESEKLLAAHHERLRAARARLEEFLAELPVSRADQDVVASPYRWRIETLRGEIELIEFGRKRLLLHAPAAGRVSLVHAREGELVATGGPVLTIVDDRPRALVAYVPETDAGRIEVGREVLVERSTRPGVEVRTRVRVAGPAVIELPEQLRTVPNVPEWALPVILEPVASGGAVPGERLFVRFP